MRRLLYVLVLLAGCERPNPIQLLPVTLQDDPTTMSGGPAGFSCRNQCVCPTGGVCNCLLFDRASQHVRPAPLGDGINADFGGATAIGSAVVDLLSFGPGPPDPNPFVVLNRCAGTPCTPILRKCFPIDLTSIRDAVDRDGVNAKGSLFDGIFDQLHASGALLTTDAPDVEVVVRLVTTTLTCDQIAGLPLRFSEWPLAPASQPYGESIFGCGYAGPLLLDNVQQALFLGLPTLDAVNCVPQVAVCANDLDPLQAGALLGF